MLLVIMEVLERQAPASRVRCSDVIQTSVLTSCLVAGIPTIIKPFFGDQFFWSDRVEALGIGSSVRKLTVDHLTAALVAATTDVKQISRAKLIGQTIRAVSQG